MHSGIREETNMRAIRRRIRVIVWLLVFSYGFFPAQASIGGWPANSALVLFAAPTDPPSQGKTPASTPPNQSPAPTPGPPAQSQTQTPGPPAQSQTQTPVPPSPTQT